MNIVFDPKRASTFRKVGRVMAFRTQDPVTFHKSWGRQEIAADAFVLIPLDATGTPTGDIYGCAETQFYETYAPVEGRSRVYAKAAAVLAYQPGEAFQVRTQLADGTVEVEAGTGLTTDWLVQNPGGETYRIDNATFQNTYEAM